MLFAVAFYNNHMNKKIVVGVALLFVVGGGIFLLQQQGSDSEIKPTQWSQAGDYKITETPDGTIIENQRAGFSFRVPTGWNQEHRKGEATEEYVFNMLSPDAAFQKDESGKDLAILGGCAISLETEYQKSTVESLRIIMASLERNPVESQQEIDIDNRPALQTNFFPPPSKYLETFGETITIEMPLTDELVLRFGTRYLPKDKNQCVQTLNEFIENISIEI